MSIQLTDAAHWYEEAPHQKKAWEYLQANTPAALLNEFAEIYRTVEEEPTPEPAPSGEWPLTKAQLGEIMLCSPSSLPDSLMDDLAACCETFGITNRTTLGYFLGQCGHESCGLRYPVEIASGSAYEWRSDLGNNQAGDGVKFAGTGWIQVTGRANHQDFADYLASIGKPDPQIMAVGKTYTSEKYPWSISGNWWRNNNMNAYCATNPDIDRVGQRVNGRYLPNGYQERRDYTRRAWEVLGV